MSSSATHPVLDPVAQQTPWFVVYSKPKQEGLALEHLLRQGFQAWYPQIKRPSSKRSKTTSVGFRLEAMFPRYIFFRPQHEAQSISTVRSTTGVSNLVRFGQEMARLSHTTVQHIARWTEQQQNLSPVELLGLKTGDKVSILAGPLKGIEALVTMAATDRVMVLLDLLGKSHEFELSCTEVLAAP